MFNVPSFFGFQFAGGFDPDAAAFFSRVTAAGGTLTTTEQIAVNQLVIDLKGYSIWTKMKAIYPMVGASAAACAQNLVSSSFTGTFNGSWTFANTGAVPTASGAYMNTNLNMSLVSNLDSTHLSYYSRTTSNGTEVEIGVQLLTNGSLVEIRTSGITYFRINSTGTYLTYSDSDSKGFYVGNRTASNVVNGWKNGTKIASGTTASSALPNLNVYIGAFNENGVANYRTTKECALSSIGDGLTDTEASNFYTAVQAFNTTLSRQV